VLRVLTTPVPSLLKHFQYFQGPCYSATTQRPVRQWRLIFYLLSFVCFSTVTNIMTRTFPRILKGANQNRPTANTITSINSILHEPTRIALLRRIFWALCLLQTFKLSKNQATGLCLHPFPIIQTCTYPCSSNWSPQRWKLRIISKFFDSKSISRKTARCQSYNLIQT